MMTLRLGRAPCLTCQMTGTSIPEVSEPPAALDPGEPMDKNFPYWMWSEACEMLVRAERLHQQLFRLQYQVARQPSWCPPVDVLETEDEVLIFIAVPGVDPDAIQAVIEDDELVVAGARVLPPAFRTAVIHRLELPQGRFERRIRLPQGAYRNVRWSASEGCLLIRLAKTGER